MQSVLFIVVITYSSFTCFISERQIGRHMGTKGFE